MRTKSRGELRRHFNYSNVMSTLSVFLVIAGGTAIAASVPQNSVRSKSVKDNTLRGKDIRDDSLTGADVQEGSLDVQLPTSLPPNGPAGGSLAGDYPNPTLAQNSVGSEQIQDDAVGNAEIAANSITTNEVAPLSLSGVDIAQDSIFGLNLAADSVSSDELLLIQARENAVVVPGAGGTNGGVATCQNNEQLISGGASVADPATMELTSSRPDATFPNNTWRASAQNNSGAPLNLTVVAYCLEP